MPLNHLGDRSDMNRRNTHRDQLIGNGVFASGFQLPLNQFTPGVTPSPCKGRHGRLIL